MSLATMDSGNFPGSVQTYPRVASSSKTAGDIRRSLHRGSLNPVEVRISHQPATVKSPQRTLLAVTATRSRVDALGNVLSKDVNIVKFQFEKGDNITYSEFVEDVELLFGFSISEGGLILPGLFNLES